MSINAIYPLSGTVKVSATTSSANVALTATQSVTNLYVTNAGTVPAFVTWALTGAATATVASGTAVAPASSVIVQIQSPNAYDNAIDVAAICDTGSATVYFQSVA